MSAIFRSFIVRNVIEISCVQLFVPFLHICWTVLIALVIMGLFYTVHILILFYHFAVCTLGILKD